MNDRPTIIIPEFDINAPPKMYAPLVRLTKEDYAYLEIWREKARKLYKKHTGFYSQEDEKLLIDPDPFDAKWYIFRVKSLRKSTPAPSPVFIPAIHQLTNQDLAGKFAL
jgi:hypothetical protein